MENLEEVIKNLEEEWEEDIEPTWLVKERKDAEELAEKFNNKKYKRKKAGDKIGRFIFVERHWHFKRKHFYFCPKCETKFIGHDSNIKVMKSCKYCKKKGLE